MMSETLKPCPLCGSTNVTCFAEYDGDSYDNEPIYRAVVGCLGCREEGCDPSYDEEPCFGIEAYYTGDHPLIKDEEGPEDCERVLEHHMAELWNRRAERTCRMWAPIDGEYRCGECGHLNRETYRADKGWYPPEYCAHCGARVVNE